MMIQTGIFGTLSQKPYWWSDKQWDDYQKGLNTNSVDNTVDNTAETYGTENYTARGGKIKRRKIKKGLTY